MCFNCLFWKVMRKFSAHLVLAIDIWSIWCHVHSITDLSNGAVFSTFLSCLVRQVKTLANCFWRVLSGPFQLKLCLNFFTLFFFNSSDGYYLSLTGSLCSLRRAFWTFTFHTTAVLVTRFTFHFQQYKLSLILTLLICKCCELWMDPMPFYFFLLVLILQAWFLNYVIFLI